MDGLHQMDHSRPATLQQLGSDGLEAVICQFAGSGLKLFSVDTSDSGCIQVARDVPRHTSRGSSRGSRGRKKSRIRKIDSSLGIAFRPSTNTTNDTVERRRIHSTLHDAPDQMYHRFLSLHMSPPGRFWILGKSRNIAHRRWPVLGSSHVYKNGQLLLMVNLI